MRGLIGRLAAAILVPCLALLTGCATPPAASRPAMVSAPPAGTEVLGFDSARRVAIACAHSAGLNVAAFTTCTREQIILSPRQQAILSCALASRETQHFAECAAPQFGIALDRQQIITADCAMRSKGYASGFTGCAGSAFGDGRITPKQQSVLDCASRARDDPTRFSACSTLQIVGPNASREQKIALTCAAQTGGNYAAFTTCAGANFFNIQLNPDQTIAIECIVSVGGLPTAAVGCMAARFITRELKTCASKGFGGAHGCFGDDNEFIGKNGWTVSTVRQLYGSRAQMIGSFERWAGSAGWMQRTRAWWAGHGAFVRDPRLFWTQRASTATATAPAHP